MYQSYVDGGGGSLFNFANNGATFVYVQREMDIVCTQIHASHRMVSKQGWLQICVPLQQHAGLCVCNIIKHVNNNDNCINDNDGYHDNDNDNTNDNDNNDNNNNISNNNNTLDNTSKTTNMVVLRRSSDRCRRSLVVYDNTSNSISITNEHSNDDGNANSSHSSNTASPPTKSLGFRGFSSSKLLILKGGNSHVRRIL